MPNELFDQMEAEVKEAEAELEKAETDVAATPVEEGEPEAPVEAKTEVADTDEDAPSEHQDEKETKDVGKVPYPQFKREREARQAAEAARQEYEKKLAVLEDRFTQLNERLTPKEEKPEIPAYEEDPFEHLRQKQLLEEQERSEFTKRLSEFEEQQRYQQANAHLHQQVVAAEGQFRVEHPDYDDAVQHLKTARAREYNAMGITDPSQIEQMLGQEAVQLAQMAFHNNRSPAQMAYEIAVSRGYSQKAAPQPVDKLANIEKGQSKSTSLSGAGGGEQRVLDIEALANMSDEEFSAAMKNGQWGKLVSST